MSIHSSGGLPPGLQRHLWLSLLSFLVDHLVDAYAKAKKCTTEGRGLMTLDLSALRSGLEKLTTLKPLPHWEFVLGWVNAYYLQETDFLAWVTAHPEYTMAQIMSIAQTGCGATKPSKERLVLIGNVTNAHVAAVDKARKEREEATRRRRAGPGVNLAADLAAAAAENVGTPATSATATRSTGPTSLSVSTPLPISMPIAHSGSRPPSRPASRSVSRAPSATNSPAISRSSSAANLAEPTLTAVVDSSANGGAAGAASVPTPSLEQEEEGLP